MDFNKGRNKMTELETLMLDVTNTLNHNGFDEVKAVPNNTQFSIRVGYWDRISASLIETMEEYHSVRITETDWEDEDCGTLYRYLVEVVDEDCGYTIDELNELDSYTEEAMYLESVGIGDDAEWGVA
tara:strand:+ start:101 stop:481 length:381 start_codon:yes stop_codon:yes gene_type:complete